MMTEQTVVLSTELHDKHLALGAKMVTFAGYHMPLQYQGLRVEHHAVRQSIGVFDVSHMGEFWVKGPDALAFLQSVVSNDVAKLTSGKIQYACLPNDKGGIVDDLLVYCESESLYMLVVNASNMAKDMAWLEGHTGGFDATISDASLETSLLAVQGPKTIEALQSLTEVDLADMTYYTYAWGRFAGVDEVLISATGYTGSGGFELYIPKVRPHKFGMPSWRQVSRMGLNLLDLLRVTRFAWRWGFVSTAMTLMKAHHRWRQALDGSPNSPKLSPTRRHCWQKKPGVSAAVW